MNASWITHCFPQDAAGSCREADGCCHATEHPSAPVIHRKHELHGAALSSSWSGLWVLPVALSAVPAGEESWEPGQQRVSSCSSREVLLVSEHTEFDSSLGRGFPVCPTGCLPFLPLLSSPNLYSLAVI